MQSRKNFFDLRGGDTVQLEKTKAELEKLGVEIDFSLEFEPDLSKYDVVHLSNVTRIQETYFHVQNARKQGKPIVLSTIFWPMEEFEKNGQVGLRKFINSHLSIDSEEKIKAFARYIKDKNSRNISTKNLWKIGYTDMQKYVVNNVDYFLPNSEMEMDAFCKSFGVKKEKYKVIPNAIDANIAQMQESADIPKEFELYKDAIICVGRIEPRKNDSFRSVIDDQIYTCQCLYSSYVAAFSSDNAALHIIVWQTDYRNCSLCYLIRSISLDRGSDDLSCSLIGFFLCFAFDADYHVRSIFADLCFEFLKEKMLCFFSCVT